MLRQTMTLALAMALATSSITPVTAGYLGVEVAQGTRGGVRIVKVIPGSPAQQLGLQEGSEILAMDDTRTVSSDEFTEQVKRLVPGAWATLSVAVGDTIVHGAITTQESKDAQRGQPFSLNGRGVLDIRLDDAAGRVRGARVTGLRRDGAGWKAGLMNGDVIVEVDGSRIASAADLIAEISARGGKRTLVTLIRRGQVQSGYVIPDVVDAKGMFANIPSPVAQHASKGNAHWCEQSELQTALCVTAGVVIVGAMVLGGGSSSQTRSGTDPAAIKKQREREAWQSFERAMDEQARTEGRRPN